MQYAQATAAEVKQAQVPHNLYVSGVFFFDLLMTPAVLAMKIGMVGLLLPLLCSGLLIGYIYLRSKKRTTWFVDAHWRLSLRNSLWLLRGYAVSALLIFIAWLITLTLHDANMKHILWTALTRVALLPTLIAVLATAVMEASAIPQAGKREVPDKIAKAFPPPAQ
ncbi:MAG TPA: hypothetical protein VFK88_14385 [Gallionella sp.]|nr:hypothetical protein [Gallionella sp.]